MRRKIIAGSAQVPSTLFEIVFVIFALTIAFRMIVSDTGKAGRKSCQARLCSATVP